MKQTTVYLTIFLFIFGSILAGCDQSKSDSGTTSNSNGAGYQSAVPAANSQAANSSDRMEPVYNTSLGDLNLDVQHTLIAPTAIAEDSEGNVYVTDTNTDSLFIYEAGTTTPVGELKGLVDPMGVAVDSHGNVYIGNSGSAKRLDYYEIDLTNKKARKIFSINAGFMLPRAIKLDNQGNVYVLDTRQSIVRVFTGEGQFLRDIGTGELKTPYGLEVASRSDTTAKTEVFVGDRNKQIRVYDTEGNLLRTLGEGVASFSTDWEGKFVNIQGISMHRNSTTGKNEIYVIDRYMHKVQVLNPDNGDYIRAFGSNGSEEGQMRIPRGFLVKKDGTTIVADTGNRRLELFQAPIEE